MIHRFYVLMIGLCICSCLSASEGIHVTFVNPSKPGNHFWDSTTRFMQAAAEDLNINLTVLYGEGNRFKTTRLALNAIHQKNPPDYLVFIYQAGEGESILKASDQAEVKTMILNTDILEEDRARIQYPGEKYPFWIGHVLPDDEQAGFDLAEYLIQTALQKFKPLEVVSMVGFSGGRDSSAARYRNSGLQRALNKYPDVHFEQMFVAHWSQESTEKMMPFVLSRYPDVKIIWAASDDMAIGASLELYKADVASGLVGGIDWTPEGVAAVQSGLLDITLGGHFMDGGWAMVLLHDYHHRKPFNVPNKTFYSKLTAITHKNVDQFAVMLSSSDWRNIDFKTYSKVYNSGMESYRFQLLP